MTFMMKCIARTQIMLQFWTVLVVASKVNGFKFRQNYLKGLKIPHEKNNIK